MLLRDACQMLAELDLLGQQRFVFGRVFSAFLGSFRLFERADSVAVLRAALHQRPSESIARAPGHPAPAGRLSSTLLHEWSQLTSFGDMIDTIKWYMTPVFP